MCCMFPVQYAKCGWWNGTRKVLNEMNTFKWKRCKFYVTIHPLYPTGITFGIDWQFQYLRLFLRYQTVLYLTIVILSGIEFRIKWKCFHHQISTPQNGQHMFLKGLREINKEDRKHTSCVPSSMPSCNCCSSVCGTSIMGSTPVSSFLLALSLIYTLLRVPR